ncbi:O-antigen ligase family protein [Nonlabens marinus]|uniref:O-antigen ligase-related domain-containing protein n=1 Tax=Nonlabens marinus S1-08 TaxID=1454201 RepID=W8VS94_9FLAO|nr:O-antigen ligase family protein [Nonlabens marinus]BAO56734.1 hypothetical protein NMS_2725 [Nonlabens marinus S1-08]
MDKKKILDNILLVIIALFSIEYVSFGEVFSVFRVLIFPLSFLGLIIINPSVGKGQSGFYIIVVLGLLANLLSAANSDDFQIGFLNAVGIFMFIFFLLNYFTKYGFSKKILKTLALFSIPQYIAFLLWIFLDFDNFANQNGRFHGLHIDPNFMCMYINAALVAKLNYIKLFKPRQTYIYILFIVLDLALITFSQSRLGILSAVLCLITYCFFFQRKKFYILLGSAVFLFTYLKNRMDNLGFSRNFNILDAVLYRFKDEDPSGNSIENARLTHLQNFLDLVDKGQSNIVGFSLENYLNLHGQYPHNLVVDIFLEQGLVVGSIFVIYIIVLIISGLLNSLKNKIQSVFFQIALISLSSSLLLTSYKQKFFWFVLVLLFLSTKKIRFHAR